MTETEGEDRGHSQDIELGVQAKIMWIPRSQESNGFVVMGYLFILSAYQVSGTL